MTSVASTENDLINELEEFCKDNGLPYMSADELLHEPDITNEECQWLVDYCDRWMEMLKAERKSA